MQRVAGRLSHRLGTFGQEALATEEFGDDASFGIAARRKRIDQKGSGTRLVHALVVGRTRPEFLIDLGEELPGEPRRSSRAEFGPALRNRQRLEHGIRELEPFGHRERRTHGMQEMEDPPHEHRRLQRVVGPEDGLGAVVGGRKLAARDGRNARALTAEKVRRGQDLAGHRAGPRLEDDGLLDPVEEPLQQRTVDRRDEPEPEDRNPAGQPELVEHRDQRALAWTRRHEAHHLALARTREAPRDVQLEPSGHAHQVARVGDAGARAEPPLKDQLVDRGDHPIRARGDHLPGGEKPLVDDDRDGHDARAREPQRLLDRIAQRGEVARLEHRQAGREREGARTEHGRARRVVLEDDRKTVRRIAEAARRVLERRDGADEAGRRNARERASSPAHRGERDGNRPGTVATEDELRLVAREKPLHGLRGAEARESREGRGDRARDDAHLDLRLERALQERLARVHERRTIGRMERSRGCVRRGAGHEADCRFRPPDRPASVTGRYDRTVRYRMLVTDLDGTLLDRRGAVSERNLAAIRRLQESGVEVVPATGRSLRECGHVLDFINHEGHAITAGGALVHDARDGSVVLRRTLDHAIVRGVAGIIAEAGHLAHLLQDHTQAGVDYLMVGDHPFDPATEWWFGHLPIEYRRVASVADHEDHGHTVRVGTIGHASLLGPVVARIASEFSDRVAVQHWSAATAEAAIGSPTHVLETFGRSVSKWTAILDLCARYGVDPAETAAVGDGLNDLEMIREAGLGIAMENADPRIAAVARARAGHHERSGFAEAAELVLAANRNA